MIKASETRSALRRLVLTKAADDWSNIINGQAAAKNNPLAQVQANATLRASGNAKDQRAFQRTPRPGPTQAQNDAWRQAQEADAARIRQALVSGAKRLVRPVVGAIGNIFSK